jgi:hydroxypyruvate reductase/glycerate 2-kinase
MVRVSERRLRDDALAIWRAGVAAVEAGALVRASLTTDSARRVAVVGAGKATTAMARAAEEVLGDRIVAGWVNVPDATVEPLRRIHVHGARKLPDNRPTEAGVEGSKRILEIARSLDADDQLLVLISGGASALLPLPVDGVTLADKVRVTALLQEAGAPIGDLNCVRKHLSQIKGGRLGAATRAQVASLIVSDVMGDALDVIGSGPTEPDPTTFADALRVLTRHGVIDRVPMSVVAHLRAGAAGNVPETPKPDHGAYGARSRHEDRRVESSVIGSNATARRAAVAEARLRADYVVVDSGLTGGDTAVAGRDAAEAIRRAAAGATASICLVSGGETTVSLPAVHGKGGRNQEFALAVLDALGPDGLAGICVLCGGTDGEDGPTDAAGAFVDEELARAAVAKGLDPADFLARHDAYHFFEPLGGLVKTGPTGTNVMDLRVVLIDRSEKRLQAPGFRL